MLKDRLPPAKRKRKDNRANQLKARAEELGHSALYATKSPAELQAYLENYSGSEKAIAYIIYGLTVNMMAMEFAKKELKIERNTKKPRARKAA